MTQSSTGFRVEARTREVVELPGRVRTDGIRTRACALCGERVGATRHELHARRRDSGAVVAGIALYAGAVAALSFGADWLWYHTGSLGSGDFRALLTAIETWPLVLPVVAGAVWLGWLAVRGGLDLKAAACHGCGTWERAARRRRTLLTFGVGAVGALLGVAGAAAADLPAAWAMVIALPLAVAGGGAATRLWPPAITWLGDRRGRVLLEVAPRLARLLIGEGRAAPSVAPRSRRLPVPAALLAAALCGFLFLGDLPVCPPGTTPVRQQHEDLDERFCLDDVGRMHGRYVARERAGPVRTLGGAHHGVASGWWYLDGQVVDGYSVDVHQRWRVREPALRHTTPKASSPAPAK